MNITLSLLKRQGLTQLEVEEITKELRDDIQKMSQESERIKSDLGFIRAESLKLQPKKKCTKCRGTIEVGTLGEGGFYIKGNRVTHIECEGIK